MEPQKTIVQSIALGDTKTTSALQVTKSYRIEGAGLGTTAENDLMLNDIAINTSVWNAQTIEFTVPEGTAEGNYTLCIRKRTTNEVLAALHVTVES